MKAVFIFNRTSDAEKNASIEYYLLLTEVLDNWNTIAGADKNGKQTPFGKQKKKMDRALANPNPNPSHGGSSQPQPQIQSHRGNQNQANEQPQQGQTIGPDAMEGIDPAIWYTNCFDQYDIIYQAFLGILGDKKLSTPMD
jgi:hypothetical protein